MASVQGFERMRCTFRDGVKEFNLFVLNLRCHREDVYLEKYTQLDIRVQRLGMRVRLCNSLNSNRLLEKSKSERIPKLKSISMSETHTLQICDFTYQHEGKAGPSAAELSVKTKLFSQVIKHSLLVPVNYRCQ